MRLVCPSYADAGLLLLPEGSSNPAGILLQSMQPLLSLALTGVASRATPPDMQGMGEVGAEVAGGVGVNWAPAPADHLLQLLTILTSGPWQGLLQGGREGQGQQGGQGQGVRPQAQGLHSQRPLPAVCSASASPLWGAWAAVIRVVLQGLLVSLQAAQNSRKSFQSLVAAPCFGTLLQLAFSQPVAESAALSIFAQGLGRGGKHPRGSADQAAVQQQLAVLAQQVLESGLVSNSQVHGLAEVFRHSAAPQLKHVLLPDGPQPELGKQLLTSAPPSAHSYHGLLLSVRNIILLMLA